MARPKRRGLGSASHVHGNLAAAEERIARQKIGEAEAAFRRGDCHAALTASTIAAEASRASLVHMQSMDDRHRAAYDRHAIALRDAALDQNRHIIDHCARRR